MGVPTAIHGNADLVRARGCGDTSLAADDCRPHRPRLTYLGGWSGCGKFGAFADRLVLETNPAVQACRRMGASGQLFVCPRTPARSKVIQTSGAAGHAASAGANTSGAWFESSLLHQSVAARAIF